MSSSDDDECLDVTEDTTSVSSADWKGWNETDYHERSIQEEASMERGRKDNDQEPVSASVNLLPDIDLITLTAIGLTLIAWNSWKYG
jgi:hypothetical protein